MTSFKTGGFDAIVHRVERVVVSLEANVPGPQCTGLLHDQDAQFMLGFSAQEVTRVIAALSAAGQRTATRSAGHGDQAVSLAASPIPCTGAAAATSPGWADAVVLTLDMEQGLPLPFVLPRPVAAQLHAALTSALGATT